MGQSCGALIYISEEVIILLSVSRL